MIRLANIVAPVCCALAVACGARADHPAPPRPTATSPLDRIAEVLRDGHSLFGLGVGCDEWRAQPGDTDVELEPDEADAGPPAAQRPTGHALTGSLIAQPDREGRIYSFTYELDLEKTPARMKLTGRGGWTPAPGVVIRRPDAPDMAVIGVGNYCVTEAEVRADPHLEDAVLIGGEAWYLTRAACARSRDPNADYRRGKPSCSRSASGK